MQQHCVEKCHFILGKYDCFHNLQNFKIQHEGKIKGNLYFSKMNALTTISTCMKHFICQGKLTVAAYVVFPVLIMNYIQTK